MANYENYYSVISSLAASGKLTFEENEPMSRHTSFKIGGNARYFILPSDAETLALVINAAYDCNLSVYVLGKGTNVLFDDDGFDGAVISTLGLNSVSVDGNRIVCGAGASLTGVSKTAQENSLKGMSFAYGIPGSVGGAVFMNAGAYTGETRDILSSSVYLDLNDMKLHTLSKQEHCFGYRTSSYKEHPERIILSATFELEKGERDEIKAEMEDFMSRRRDKQPLEYPSAGSTFKRYPGRYTAQMIDSVGLKGVRVGGAEVSEKHAGFVINKENASSKDVKELINLIQDRIRDEYGIEIEREVIYVPEK